MNLFFRACCTALVSVAVGLSASPSLPARGCAAAPPPGARIGIAGEEALIVWNRTTHTEDFIRRAVFVGQAPQFGFLVPTPSPPRLSETYSNIFHTLAQTYRPHFAARPEYGLKLSSITGLLFPTFAAAKGRVAFTQTAALPHVSVLDAEQVAGYDAVVLRADDAAALAAWLRTHGYEARPALADWLRPYVARHWTLTAFKMAKPDARQAALTSATVRMSFTTNRPFFPYSEPADQRDGHQPAGNRLLRVYCAGDARMDGALDSTAVRWPGKARWAEALPLDMRDQVLGTGDFLQDHTPTTLWLTAFEDTSSPRPGVADLYFSPAATQTPLVPTVFWPEDHRFGIPVELVLAALIYGIAKLRRYRESRQQIPVSRPGRQAPSADAAP